VRCPCPSVRRQRREGRAGLGALVGAGTRTMSLRRKSKKAPPGGGVPPDPGDARVDLEPPTTLTRKKAGGGARGLGEFSTPRSSGTFDTLETDTAQLQDDLDELDAIFAAVDGAQVDDAPPPPPDDDDDVPPPPPPTGGPLKKSGRRRVKSPRSRTSAAADAPPPPPPDDDDAHGGNVPPPPPPDDDSAPDVKPPGMETMMRLRDRNKSRKSMKKSRGPISPAPISKASTAQHLAPPRDGGARRGGGGGGNDDISDGPPSGVPPVVKVAVVAASNSQHIAQVEVKPHHAIAELREALIAKLADDSFPAHFQVLDKNAKPLPYAGEQAVKIMDVLKPAPSTNTPGVVCVAAVSFPTKPPAVLPQEVLTKAMKAFAMYDKDGRAVVPVGKLMDLLHTFGCTDINEREAECLLVDCRCEKSGWLSFTEFMVAIELLHRGALVAMRSPAIPVVHQGKCPASVAMREHHQMMVKAQQHAKPAAPAGPAAQPNRPLTKKEKRLSKQIEKKKVKEQKQMEKMRKKEEKEKEKEKKKAAKQKK